SRRRRERFAGRAGLRGGFRPWLLPAHPHLLPITFVQPAGGSFAAEGASTPKPLLPRAWMVAVTVVIRVALLRRRCGGREEAGEQSEQSYRAPGADHGQ